MACLPLCCHGSGRPRGAWDGCPCRQIGMRYLVAKSSDPAMHDDPRSEATLRQRSANRGVAEAAEDVFGAGCSPRDWNTSDPSLRRCPGRKVRTRNRYYAKRSVRHGPDAAEMTVHASVAWVPPVCLCGASCCLAIIELKLIARRSAGAARHDGDELADQFFSYRIID